MSKQKAGSNGPLLCGKQTTFEGGMRTPTIAWWASRKAKGVSHYLGSHMDFLPTLAELAGASLPPSLHLDGHSISNILLSTSHVVSISSPPVFYYRGNILYAVRWENYKVLHASNNKAQYSTFRLISGPGPPLWKSWLVE